MSTFRTVRRAAALSAVSGLLLCGSAEAARTATFDLQTGTTVTSGRAHGYGRVTFPTRETVKIRAKLDDRCSASGRGDGYSAYMKVTTESGDISVRRLPGKDERGCTAAPRTVFFDFDFGRPIDRLTITVFESRPRGGIYDTSDVPEDVRRSFRP
ncbi:hypothetical protein [Patulibacter sp.]|uniref:hypothetical protein n=1 Tax=Patulibacter sp. TaxID=1912859 RepID=UPI00271FBA86|nr:hypothetical protein [Patulibacter sp.]MDO9409454.1 hypothetical protein [Patulibacter sp.]